MRVLFLVNIASPYRVDFFAELGKYCDLTVVFENRTSKAREESWLNTKKDGFKSVFLSDNKQVLKSTIIKYLNKDLYDIFVVGGYSTKTAMIAIEVMKIKKIKFVLNADGGFIRAENIFRKTIKKHFISSATYWLSTGERTNRYLEYYGAKKENIFIYPFTSLFDNEILGEPIEQGKKEELRESLGMNGKVVVFVGNIIHRKGVDILLRACKHVDDGINIYLIGGEPSEEYINLVNSQNLKNVNFIGFKKKAEVLNYLKAADLFVLPTREDIWGLVINEAMACGLPVITTEKCLAGLELIENGVSGYVVPINNAEEIAYKINHIFRTPELLKKMGNNSLSTIKEYSIERMAKKTYEYFEKIQNDKAK